MHGGGMRGGGMHGVGGGFIPNRGPSPMRGIAPHDGSSAAFATSRGIQTYPTFTSTAGGSDTIPGRVMTTITSIIPGSTGVSRRVRPRTRVPARGRRPRPVLVQCDYFGVSPWDYGSSMAGCGTAIRS